MGILDPGDEAHRHAAERLRDETIVWLTTVNAGGQPQSSPVWFFFDGETFLIYSQPSAGKLPNIRANPRVSLHLNDDGVGDDVVTFEGRAELSDDPPAHEVPEYLDRYRDRIANYGWTDEGFAKDYSQPIRVTPTRVRID